MSEATKKSEFAAVSAALSKVRVNLNDALDSLQKVLSDPSTPNHEAIKANDLYKSLKRFAAKL